MTHNLANKKIRINEIFGPTIQGEGILIGQPTIFVRTGGCDFRCSWCDTLYAVDSSMKHSWFLLEVHDIWKKIEKLSQKKPLTITLSGGNPAIQPLKGLILKGLDNGYSFAMETQGSIIKDWFDLLSVLVLSPKPPSSHMENNWEIFSACLGSKAKKKIIKIPILNEEDFQFAKNIKSLFPETPLYLQPVNHTPPPLKDEGYLDLNGIYARLEWLINRTIKEKWYDVCILPQLHVLIWKNKKGV